LLLLLAAPAVLHLLRALLTWLRKRRALHSVNNSDRDAVNGELTRRFWHLIKA
jgi:hypothetical protein